jgi:hypothetical protein
MRWILLVFGVIGIAAGIQEWRIRSARPPRISCAELAEKGADGPIELTGFLFRSEAARWPWVPAVPFGDDHAAAAVRVLVELHEQSDPEQTAEQDTLRGTVAPATDGMQAAYPGVKWVVYEDRKLAAWGTIGLYLGAGVIALALFTRSLRGRSRSTTSAP